MFLLPKGVGRCPCGGWPQPRIYSLSAEHKYTKVAELRCACGRYADMGLEHSHYRDPLKDVESFAYTVTDVWNNDLKELLFEHDGPSSFLPVRTHLFYGAILESLRREVKRTSLRDFVFESGNYFSLTNSTGFIEHVMFKLDREMVGEIAIAQLTGEAWVKEVRFLHLRDAVTNSGLIWDTKVHKGTKVYIHTHRRHQHNRLSVIITADEPDASALIQRYKRFPCGTLHRSN